MNSSAVGKLKVTNSRYQLFQENFNLDKHNLADTLKKKKHLFTPKKLKNKHWFRHKIWKKTLSYTKN